MWEESIRKSKMIDLREKLEFGDESGLHQILEDYREEAVLLKDFRGETLLHYVTRLSSIEMARHLIQLGADVNALNNMGSTPLYEAVKWKTEMVQLLLENGADWTIIKKSGETHLQRALDQGSVETLDLLLRKMYDGYEGLRKFDTSRNQVEKVEAISKFLLNEEVDLNFCGSGYFLLLQFVLKYGDEKTFKFVLHSDKKFDVNSQGPEKHTILHWAIHLEKEVCVKHLIDFGADVNAEGKYQNTALHYACRKDNEALVRFFLDLGADVDKTTSFEKHTALHNAVVVGNKKIIDMLLEAGADIKAKFGNGYIIYRRDESAASVLNLVCGVSILRQLITEFHARHFEFEHIFCGNPKPYFNGEMIEFLLERGADTELVYENMVETDGEDSEPPLYYDDQTPLQRAIREGRLDIVNLLLSYGADINAKNPEGRTALHQAIFVQNIKIIEFLLEKGLDINARDICGCTPLHYVIQEIQDNTIPLIEFLVDNGANVNIPNKLQRCSSIDNFGPLQMAKRPDIIECLLELKADFRAQKTRMDWNFSGVEKAREHYSSECNKVLIAFMAMTEDKLCDRRCFVTLDNEEEGVWNDFFNSCKFQVRQMMDKYISEDKNVTFFDFLNNDLLRATAFGRSEGIMQVLDSEKYKEEFPHYAFLLEKRIERVKAMLRFRDAVTDLIKEYAEIKLPIPVVEHILHYLEVKDFRNVARALSLIKLNDVEVAIK